MLEFLDRACRLSHPYEKIDCHFGACDLVGTAALASLGKEVPAFAPVSAKLEGERGRGFACGTHFTLT